MNNSRTNTFYLRWRKPNFKCEIYALFCRYWQKFHWSSTSNDQTLYATRSIGEKMDQTGIRMTDVGKFTIQYFKNNIKKIHYLDFGNDYKMSSCSCYTWKKSAYPCKHFLAVFQKVSAFQDCIETRPSLI